MKANPGGQIAPKEVVGRDRLIEQIWRVLRRQSAILTAERRMGKTTIIKKMEAEPPSNMITIYCDLEAVGTPVEFVELIYRDVEQYLSTSTRFKGRARKVLEEIGGTEVGGVFKIPEIAAWHWKILLRATFEDLVHQQQDRVILFWDEMPYMLQKIKSNIDEQTAIEVLDILRALRQDLDVRMVYTGSIGLHNVLTSLKDIGYANAPINDMKVIDVPALDMEDAEHLVKQLLIGEEINVDGKNVAITIAQKVDCIPYYIHQVVDDLVGYDEVDEAVIEKNVQSRLTDPQDTWNLAHYAERIKTYYIPREYPLVHGLLDRLEASEIALTFDEVFNLLKLQVPTEDAESTRQILTRLQRDHYIIMNSDGRYQFRFPIIQQWWRLYRGLGS